MRYWKVLDEKGHACHGGTFAYNLPKNGKPGEWTPRVSNIEACKQGYHVCRDADLVHWCNGATIYACEVRGKVIAQDDKVVAESIPACSPYAVGRGNRSPVRLGVCRRRNAPCAGK